MFTLINIINLQSDNLAVLVSLLLVIFVLKPIGSQLRQGIHHSFRSKEIVEDLCK